MCKSVISCEQTHSRSNACAVTGEKAVAVPAGLAGSLARLPSQEFLHHISCQHHDCVRNCPFKPPQLLLGGKLGIATEEFLHVTTLTWNSRGTELGWGKVVKDREAAWIGGTAHTSAGRPVPRREGGMHLGSRATRKQFNAGSYPANSTESLCCKHSK